MTVDGSVGEGLASLGMYPFAELRWAYDRYWEAVTERLDWVPRVLNWDIDPVDSWSRDDLVVGQTCGWPLVTHLRDRVRVVGAFAAASPHADGYSYRAVVLATRPDELSAFVGDVAAVNSTDSLSGWISLLAAVHGPGARWQGGVVTTGSHLDSLRALQRGDAQIASIDSVTLWHTRRWLPELLDGLVQVGLGPLVPSLPIVTAASTSDQHVQELRLAMIDAVYDPLVEPAATAMCTQGFVPLDLEHYLPILDLAPA